MFFRRRIELLTVSRAPRPQSGARKVFVIVMESPAGKRRRLPPSDEHSIDAPELSSHIENIVDTLLEFPLNRAMSESSEEHSLMKSVNEFRSDGRSL